MKNPLENPKAPTHKSIKNIFSNHKSKVLKICSSLAIYATFTACNDGYNPAYRYTLMQNSDSKIYADFDQDIQAKQISKRGKVSTSFFARDSILEESDIALESQLAGADFSIEARAELTRAHQQYKQSVIQMSENVSKNWANDEFKVSSAEEMVKYTDGYLSRSIIDFKTGKISVETIDKDSPLEALQNAIAAALLTPQNPHGMDLYSDKDIKADGKPFLAGLVKDNEGQDITGEWRAKKYAKFLVENQLKERSDAKGNKVYFVEMQMSDNFQNLASNNYEGFARKYAAMYNLQPALVMAIIRTESNFNPYAMSHIPAYGLMQIVPSTAGADSYELINGKKGRPSKDMLFTPETNIQYGSAYLNILYTRYLKGINNPQSQEYCVIAAYNAGSGNVLNTFSRDRKQAINVINTLTPEQVYKKLTTKMNNDEGRRYLQKVTNFKKQYVGM